MLRYLVALVGCAGWLLVRAEAQVRPVYDTGAAGLVQVLERLQTTASVLHTGAHPDDEDSAFLARAARGDHARVAYLSLNRGEGGQNIIGTEIFEALGVIRTEELLQARRLDGVDQFFTRVIDYGFSKSRDEAARKWNERDVLGDMVRVIRTFRPLVIYSRWGGTPEDGHGQHQFAGFLTPRAFRAAADPNEFPEQLQEGLRPWRTRKLYSRPIDGQPATIQVQTGVFDPVLGRTYAEIAFEGRSQHRSQSQGSIETLGPLASALRAVEGAASGTATEQSIFDGLDVSLPGLAALAGLPGDALRSELDRIAAAATRALQEYRSVEPARAVPALVDGLTAVRAARQALRSLDAAAGPRADADFLLACKEEEFTTALIRAAGVIIDPLADEETAVPGGTFGVNVRVFLTQPAIAAVTSLRVDAPAGWAVKQAADRAVPEGNRFRREVPTRSARYDVAVPATASVSQPYFLEEARRGDSYRWPQTAERSLPFSPPLMIGTVGLTVGGIDIVASQPVEYRFADRIRGELRRTPAVVPRVTVGLDTSLLVVPLGTVPNRLQIVARVSSASRDPVSGTLRLRPPTGWTVAPADAAFTLRSAGEQTAATFTVVAPANRTAGTFQVAAEALVGGAAFAQDVQLVSYPHIQTHRLYWPARAHVEVVDVKVAPVHVGYVMGGGDQVPEAIRRLGVDVTMLDSEMLTTGDLSRFDTIVVGIRASETRPDFVASHGRLLQFVERGGTLVVQYQQGDYADRNLPPYPAVARGNPRVTDETAPVTMLAPAHPVFTFPNRITNDDFTGWVQERNLYSFAGFDQRYTPLLESADPGEAPQRGGELYAEVGKGRYVYTSYAWFRQLPAGVPGAYRQFANLISLSKAPR